MNGVMRESSKYFEIRSKLQFLLRLVAVMVTTTLCMSWAATSHADTGGGPVSAREFKESRKFVETDFGRIAYVERGSGPVALFVHGALLNGYQWRHQMNALSDIRRCIALDTMGMGYTEPAPGVALTMKNQAAMIRAFLDAMSIDQVDLVGNDSGGGAVQIFAATNPERVRSMTLTNCEVHDYDKENPVSEQLHDLVTSGALADTVQFAVEQPEQAKVSFATTFQYPDKLEADTIRTYFEPIAATPGRLKGMENYFLSTSSAGLLEIEDQLTSLDVPVLVIWGTADTFFDKKWAYWLKDNLKDVRDVVEVEGGLVFFPEENPEVMNGNLRRFWTQ